MAKKKNKKAPQPKAEQIINQEPISSVPKFEIGVKGDEFDLAYTKAAKQATLDTDRLLYNLSRESRADKFNLLDALVPFILIVFTALAFITISRGDISEAMDVKFSLKALADGSYTQMLDRVYSDTLPYGEELRYFASLFGFGDAEKPAADVEDVPEEETPIEPDVTEPAVTEPTVTTTQPTTTETTTTPPPVTEPERVFAIVNSNVNVRSEPSSSGKRLGYLAKGEEVEITDILDGWYEIIYNGEIAYAYGEYLTVIENAVTTPSDSSSDISTEEPLEYETFPMIANGTVTIRLSPSSSGVNVGYFIRGDRVDVIELREDGWAMILFYNDIAYVWAEYLEQDPDFEYTTAPEPTEEVTTAQETEENITEVPEDDSEDETSETDEVIEDFETTAESEEIADDETEEARE